MWHIQRDWLNLKLDMRKFWNRKKILFIDSVLILSYRASLMLNFYTMKTQILKPASIIVYWCWQKFQFSVQFISHRQYFDAGPATNNLNFLWRPDISTVWALNIFVRWRYSKRVQNKRNFFWLPVAYSFKVIFSISEYSIVRNIIHMKQFGRGTLKDYLVMFWKLWLK